jgi:hypothetical protein
MKNKPKSLFKKSTNLPKIVQGNEEDILTITNNSLSIYSSKNTLSGLQVRLNPIQVQSLKT